MRRTGEERLFHCGVGGRQLKQWRLTGFTQGECRLQTFAARQRTADQSKNFVDALHGASGIAGGSSSPTRNPT